MTELNKLTIAEAREGLRKKQFSATELTESFLAAIEAELYTLAVVGVLSSVVGAFYYVRIVKIMYFDEPAEAFERPIPREIGAVITVSALFVVLFVVFPSPIVDAAAAAASVLFPF